MFNLTETLKNSRETVYVRLPDLTAAERFLREAEADGFLFSDGAKPTQKQPALFFAVHPDRTVNYIGTVGRIACQCNAVKLICLAPTDGADGGTFLANRGKA